MDNKPVYQQCFECCIKKMIECRAFEIYEYRQEYQVIGDDKTDWKEAEAEILEKLAGGYKPLI